MYSSNNATSKYLNKTGVRFETENTLLRYDVKDHRLGVSKEIVKSGSIADFDLDMEEELDDIVIKKIGKLMPLEKKLINSLTHKIETEKSKTIY